MSGGLWRMRLDMENGALRRRIWLASRRCAISAVVTAMLGQSALAWHSSISMTAPLTGPSTQVIGLDLTRFPICDAAVLVNFSSGASGTANVQVTGDGLCGASGDPTLTCPSGSLTPTGTQNWNNHDTLVSLVNSANGNIQFPVTGVRLNMMALSSGTVTVDVVECDPH